MARSRLQKTLADYLVIAVSPALIMLLVGSLVFFLLEMLYSGQYDGTLQWTLFWFVFASVLISRIGIEQGSLQASVYGLALAFAMGLGLMRLTDFALGAWGLMAVIWWCTSKLTWDCTLIDDSEDASGQGLLQAAGIDGDDPESSTESLDRLADRPEALRDAGTNGGARRVEDLLPWWQRVFLNRSERPDQPHAPGLWVVYFSLAALPIFGIGQAVLSSEDSDGRRYSFQLLWVYVASALALLMTTSFLGLRRYLRQRKLQMPTRMAASWIATGTVLIGGILLLAILLPRPQAEYSVTGIIDKIGGAVQDAHDRAFPNDEAGEGEGERRGEGEQDGQGQGQNPGDSSDAGAEGADGEADSQGQTKGQGSGPQDGSGGRDGQKSGEGNKNQVAQNDRSGRRQSTPQFDPQSLASHWPADIVKWLLYGLLALGVVYLLVRYGNQLVEFLRRLWLELVALWNRLFGRKEAETDDETATEESVRSHRPRPFASFANPFVTGTAQRLSPADLVCYSFEALQAWAYEQNVPRHPDQTPYEFAQVLSTRASVMSNEVKQLAQAYARLAYAGQSPSRECLDHLERLWRRMTNSP